MEKGGATHCLAPRNCAINRTVNFFGQNFGKETIVSEPNEKCILRTKGRSESRIIYMHASTTYTRVYLQAYIHTLSLFCIKDYSFRNLSHEIFIAHCNLFTLNRHFFFILTLHRYAHCVRVHSASIKQLK